MFGAAWGQLKNVQQLVVDGKRYLGFQGFAHKNSSWLCLDHSYALHCATTLRLSCRANALSVAILADSASNIVT